MLLKEKSASFLEDVNQRFEGNVAVVPRPGGDVEEDGSIEISGTLYTDIFRSATTNTQIIIGDPFHILEKPIPSAPPQGKIVLYSDDTSDSRLYTLNYLGQKIDLNPARKRGDLVVYDSVVDTTKRFPTGTVDQVLTLDTNPGNSLRWKPSTQYDEILLNPSSQYIKYLKLENNNTTISNLTSSFENIDFGIIKRIDSAYSILTSSVFEINEIGNYNFNYRISVGTNDDFLDVANFTIVLQKNTVDVPGSEIYGIIKGGIAGETYTTVTGQVLLNVTVGQQFRFRIKESSSTTLSLYIKQESCSINVEKIIINSDATDTSEIASVYGDGTVVLSGSTKLDMSIFLVKTNSMDSLASDELVFSNTGLRHVFSKIVTSSTNLPADGNARVRIVMLKNNVEINSSISHASVYTDSVGTQMNVSCLTSALISFNATDTLSVKVEIISQSAAADIIVLQNESMIGSILYSSNSTASPSIWEKMNTRLVSTQTLEDRQFNNVKFDTNDILDGNYQYNSFYPGIISISKYGSYLLYFKCTIENTTGDTLTTGSRILVDTLGNGFKEIVTSRSLINIPGGLSQTISINELIHVPSNSMIRIQVLGMNGMNIIANGSNLLLYRLESSISVIPGSSVFGTFFHYKKVNGPLITTSTSNILFTSLTTGLIPDGVYKITWQFDYTMSIGGQEMFVELYIGGVLKDTINEKPTNVDTYLKRNSIITETFSAGVQTIEIRGRTQDSIISKSLELKNYSIEFFRLE
jgi:hypothetical protein